VTGTGGTSPAGAVSVSDAGAAVGADAHVVLLLRSIQSEIEATRRALESRI
jgi:hypothetical protein